MGVLANDCMFDGGAMTAEGAAKIRRFVELCDLFHIPIVSFVDEPGFTIGSEAEKAGTIRAGMNAMFAMLQSQRALVRLRRAPLLRRRPGHPLGPGATVVAWPSADERSAARRERRRPGLPRRDRGGRRSRGASRASSKTRWRKAQSVMPRAEEFGVHDLIDPRDTRPTSATGSTRSRPKSRPSTCAGAPRYSIRP